MFNIHEFIVDNSFKFNFSNNALDIINYIKINYMDIDKISIKTDIGNLVISGTSLVVKKMLDSEVLITGNINKLEIIK